MCALANGTSHMCFVLLKRGEKHQCVVASYASPAGDLAHNPGTCPDWDGTRNPLVPRPALNPLSQGLAIRVLIGSPFQEKFRPH